jgi:hypothetical protein
MHTSFYIHTRYVPSKANPADGPSRGIFPSRGLLLPHIPIPRKLRDFIIDFDAGLNATELRLRREGITPKPLPKSPCNDASNKHASLHDLERRQLELLAEEEGW